ncbi:acylphosphatase [Salinicoccus sp. CNSTN-B1]
MDERDGTGKVIELNSSVGLGGHLFPLEGKSQDIPSALMDYYFPGTERITTDLYFDFTKVTGMLKAGNVHEIIMPVLPQEKIIKKSFIIKGKLEKVGFVSFVRKKARYFSLNGFVEMRSDKSVLIVVAGTERNVNNFREILAKYSPKRVRIDNITEGEWQGVLEAGFEVIRTAESEKAEPEQRAAIPVVDDGHLQKLKKTNTKLKKINVDLKKTNKELEKEITRLKKENEDFQSSKSWQVTRPLRLLSKKMAKRKN